MPLENNDIGLSIDKIAFKFGDIAIEFFPYSNTDSLKDYWIWTLVYKGLRRGMIYSGLYIPGGMTVEIVKGLVNVWLRDNMDLEVANYWNGGAACH